MKSDKNICMMSLFNHATKESVNTVPVHAMQTYQRRRGKAPLILNLRITWSWVVKCTPRPLYLRYQLNTRFSEPQSRRTFSQQTEIPCPRRKSIPGSPNPQPIDLPKLL